MTKEQIEKAKKWDLLSYLQTFDPHELKRSGPNEYCTRTHDSLKISCGLWCWNSRGIGGRTALDYLIKVRGLDFTEAVETLCGSRAPPPQERPKPKPPKPFALPEASRFPTAMLSYLQGRGIHPELLQACIQAGTLYESRKYQNCVFVGRDPTGRARFACLRGTRDSHYLSLGGTAPRAMLQFLRDHPHVTHLSLCLDNDKAGMEGMERLETAIREVPELAQRVKLIYHNPPPAEHGKDYNEFLCTQLKRERDVKHKKIVENCSAL